VKGTCWLAMSGRVEEGPRGALFSVALWWLCLECSPVLLGCCWLLLLVDRLRDLVVLVELGPG
jgi:hypothetical protein